LGNILTVSAGAICGPVCSTLASAAVAGLASGDLGAALKAGFISAVTAGAFQLAGDLTSGLTGFDKITGEIDFLSEAHVFNIASHAAIGCGSSVASGGDCGPGALSGAVGSFATPLTNGLSPEGRLTITTVSGGLASFAGGGKFGNGALTAAFGYLFSPQIQQLAEELRNSKYAATYVDFWGDVKVDYYDSYNYGLDPISQEAVRVHEQVHVEQLTPFVIKNCPWGCAAMTRAIWSYGGTNAMEIPAYEASVDFLRHTLSATPRQQWTNTHRASNEFLLLQQGNLFRARQYERQGNR
jgi:hypothetical protein